jgi:hypothetical protein
MHAKSPVGLVGSMEKPIAISSALSIHSVPNATNTPAHMPPSGYAHACESDGRMLGVHLLLTSQNLRFRKFRISPHVIEHLVYLAGR